MNYIQNLNRITVVDAPATDGFGFVCNFVDAYGTTWAGATKILGYRRT